MNKAFKCLVSQLIVGFICSSIGQACIPGRSNNDPCYLAQPVNNFNATASLGVWYNWIGSANLDDADKKCFTKDYTAIVGNTLVFTESYVEDNGTMIGPEQSIRNLSNTSQAIIMSTKNITLLNGTWAILPVQSVIVYTDYTNVQLRYACGPRPDMPTPYTYYFLLVRSRTFNNLAILLQAFEKLNQIQPGETFVWLHNDLTSCPH